MTKQISTDVEVRYTNTNMGDPVAIVDFSAFEPTDQAAPSARCLSGSDDHWAAAEYTEDGHVVIDGERRKAVRVFLFSAVDITDETGEPIPDEDYPWDAKHCARILLLD